MFKYIPVYFDYKKNDSPKLFFLKQLTNMFKNQSSYKLLLENPILKRDSKNFKGFLPIEKRVDTLLEFVTTKNRIPYPSEKIAVDGINFEIGGFWVCTKQGIYNGCLPRLLENPILKRDMYGK